MRRLRPESMIVAVLIVLSAGVIAASVEAASSGLRRSPMGAQTEIPVSLFELEPARPVLLAPVDAGLQEESQEAVPAPSPSPSPAQKPVVGPSPPPKPVAPPSPTPGKITAFQVLFAAAADNRGRHGSVRYVTTIKNTGETVLSSINFSSHVPQGTKWSGGSGCGSSGFPIEVTYGNEASSVACMPGSPPLNGSSDPEVHQVSLGLSRDLPPGAEVHLAVTFEITDPSLKKISNHAHAEASGLRISSEEVGLEIR